MTAPASAQRLPAGIWALGFVSLLMDISSELVHSLLPLFMVTVLGASMLTVGLIEGAAEATAAIDDHEMNRTFNNGIGMVVVVAPAEAAAVAGTLRRAGETVHEIGRIVPRGTGAAVTLA